MLIDSHLVKIGIILVYPNGLSKVKLVDNRSRQPEHGGQDAGLCYGLHDLLTVSRNQVGCPAQVEGFGRVNEVRYAHIYLRGRCDRTDL